ncbi:MAG: hypothetical protein R3E89_05990 [Thiolinea sp.]
MSVDLITVIDAIPIGIRDKRIGAIGIDLLRIRQPIQIGIALQTAARSVTLLAKPD